MTLTSIQQSIVRTLAAHPFFAGQDGERPIEVIAGNDKSLLAKAQAAMGKLGLCVTVYPMSADFGAQSASIPYLEKAIFNCRVRENVITNRSSSGTGQPADYVAEICGQVLHQHKPLAEDGTPLSGGGFILKGIVPDEDEPGINAYNLILHIAAGVSHEPVRLDFSNSIPPP